MPVVHYDQIVAEIMALPRNGRRAALLVIKAFLDEAQRAEEARSHPGVEATNWEARDAVGTGYYDTRDEALAESEGEFWSIVELTGHGVVHQEFVVIIPVADAAGEAADREFESFPTRAEAQDYVDLRKG